MIGWGSAGFELLSDCRSKFENLVDLTARHADCAASSGDAGRDVGGGAALQALLDTCAAKKPRVTVSLKPGIYALGTPLRLTSRHSGLTLEACRPGAVLMAKAGTEENFLDGLVVFTGTNAFTLRGLQFELPVHKTGVQNIGSVNVPLFTAIGVRPIGCADFVLAECRFDLHPPAQTAKAILCRPACVPVRLAPTFAFSTTVSTALCRPTRRRPFVWA